MRVEPTPHVFRSEKRRPRFEEVRPTEKAKHDQDNHPEERARHELHIWFAPAFYAHILGQATPPVVTPEQARMAYSQPESRTPLRPQHVARA
jgi:hypothetical protein